MNKLNLNKEILKEKFDETKFNQYSNSILNEIATPNDSGSLASKTASAVSSFIPGSIANLQKRVQKKRLNDELSGKTDKFNRRIDQTKPTQQPQKTGKSKFYACLNQFLVKNKLNAQQLNINVVYNFVKSLGVKDVKRTLKSAGMNFDTYHEKRIINNNELSSLKALLQKRGFVSE
jgi:hypothetical protein